MRAHPWHGNVRELWNKLMSAMVMAEGPYITAEDLGLGLATDSRGDPVTPLRAAVQRLERQIITQALALHGGNLTRVAEELGISRPTLYAHLRRYGIRTDRAALLRAPGGAVDPAPGPSVPSPS
jgi:two-component system NtrC family response regulator